MPGKIFVELTDASGYNQALEAIKPTLARPLHFLSAPFYGRWQEAADKKVVYFVLKNADAIKGAGLAVAYWLPGGYYFYYCPYGPLTTSWTASEISAIKAFFTSLNDKKLLFARLDASLPPSLLARASESVASVSSLQPRNEWLLELTPSESDLLANMHKKARYHINLTDRKGASFRAEKCSPAELETFYGLMKTTAERDKFHILPKSDYAAAFKTLGQNAFVGYVDYDGRPIASALVISYDKMAYYVYGCSSDEYRKLGAGYYLQWRCLLRAKASGDKIYNFGGISGGVKGAQLAGVTQFKTRFGGYNQSHDLPSDIVISPLGYQLFSLYKKLR